MAVAACFASASLCSLLPRRKKCHPAPPTKHKNIMLKPPCKYTFIIVILEVLDDEDDNDKGDNNDISNIIINK